MDLVYDLPIPANTTADEPEELELPIFSGIIHLVEIEIPPGPKGLVYAAVRQGVHQVWPTNPDGAYRSDGRVFSTREHYPIGRSAPALTIQGWSPGTSYPHTVQFRFSVLPREVLEPWQEQVSLLGKIAKAFGVKK